MNTQVKVGTKVTVPLLAGMSITSSDPTVIGVSNAGTQWTMTASKIGQAWLTVQFAGDVKASVLFSVLPT